MGKFLFASTLAFLLLFSFSKVLAQETEPGTNLPLLPDESATATDTSTTSTGSFSTLTTATTSLATSTTSTQTAVDDAETGTEVIFLAILSVTGGLGIFLIKKYFDFKRYSL